MTMQIASQAIASGPPAIVSVATPLLGDFLCLIGAVSPALSITSSVAQPFDLTVSVEPALTVIGSLHECD